MAMDFLSRSYEYKKRSHSLEWLLSMLALPIFPGRLQPSIVGRSELNFRVRDGNGWTLALISTNCCIATVLYSNKPFIRLSSRAEWHVQAFCTAKPCRRANSFRPRIFCPQGFPKKHCFFGMVTRTGFEPMLTA